jgi:hypothetical protein
MLKTLLHLWVVVSVVRRAVEVVEDETDSRVAPLKFRPGGGRRGRGLTVAVIGNGVVVDDGGDV